MTLAMVYPGQGSQSVGMLRALADQHEEVRQTFSEAGEVLDYDLWDLVQNGPLERLDNTVVTQSAMLSAGVACWRAWRGAGGREPSFMAGHSLGEYTALVCANALPFADALRLVRRRAELMQAAAPAGEGAMAAILGLDDETVIAACERAADGQVVSAVNFNAPGQVVIAGGRAAVERAMEEARSAGAKRTLLLNVSVPSHCDLMRPAAEELSRTLAEIAFANPAVPVLGNADVRPYENAVQIRTGLEKQLYSPVRWVDTVRYLVNLGSRSVIECGPGKVLAGLVKRIDRSVPAACIDSPEALQTALGSAGAGAR
ncbi:MAG: ACP S-malonyltransferase [Woeseia sp.]